MLLKIVVFKNAANFTGKLLVSKAFLEKLKALRTATLLKAESCEIYKIFKNSLIY